MSFSKNDLDKIKSKISIRNELEKKSKIIQKGKDFWCCCPFHEEKTPSCKINEDLGSFYCFGCGAKGDIFTIFTDLYNFSFVDAVKELSSQAGIQIDFQSIEKNNQDSKINEILEASCKWFEDNLEDSFANTCNQYLKNRKLSEVTIKKFRLGYSSNSKSNLYEYLKKRGFEDKVLIESNIIKLDKNNNIRDFFYKRLIFPIMNIQGLVVGFGGRSLDDSNPKYINSPESKIFQKRLLLYNLNIAKNSARKKNNLLICEGYMDVISLHQNGIISVVAPLGTALTDDQLALSWKYSSKPTIMFDGDNAGLRASYKSAIMALPLISVKKFLQFVTIPMGYDPDTYINEVSFQEFVEVLKKPTSLSEFIFNESSKSVSLDKVDERISYDKYLEELGQTIKDSKSQYFYKAEFKSLFFNWIRKSKDLRGNIKSKSKSKSKELNINLNTKQNLSFIATAINHISIREIILNKLIKEDLLSSNEKLFVLELKKIENIEMNKDKIFTKYLNGIFAEITKNTLSSDIYQLFSYSSPLNDAQESVQEVDKSINNLNTRLSNLKKINKSLDRFINNSNQLNWSDLQKINIEISHED